ncbi:MAG: hypothetical protein ACRERC_05815 [Candidatus Binatia bacterium]
MPRPPRPELRHAAGCGAAASDGAAGAAEVRCDCGSLLARWTPQGVELKCRRCKRHVILPIEDLPPP